MPVYRNASQGFALLYMVLFVSILTLGIAFAMGNAIFSILRYEQFAAAHLQEEASVYACAEQALQDIGDGLLSGGTTIARGAIQCGYHFASSGTNQYAVYATSNGIPAVTIQARVDVSTGTVVVTSWTETP